MRWQRSIAWCRDRPRRTLITWGLLTSLATLFATRLQPDNSLTAFRAPGHGAERDYETARRLFPEDDLLLLAIEPTGDLDSDRAEWLRELWDLHQRIGRSPAWHEPIDAFLLDPALRFSESAPRADTEGEFATGLAELPPLLDRRRAVSILIADAGRASELVLAESIHDAVEPLEKQGARVWFAGNAETEFWMESANRQTLERSMPILLIVAAGVLITLLRSVRLTLAVVLTLLPIVVIGAGVLGAIGASLNAVTVVLPILLSTIVLGTLLHVVLPIDRQLGACPTEFETVLAEVLADRARPAAWAHCTTSIGFGSLASSPIETVRHLGVAAGIAVALGFLAVITLLPALLSLLRPKGRPQREWQSPLGRVLTWSGDALASVHARARWPILILTTAALPLAFFGLRETPVESDALTFFPEEHPLPRGVERLEKAGFPSGVTELIWPAESAERVGDEEIERVASLLRAEGAPALSAGLLVRSARSLLGPVALALDDDAVLAALRVRHAALVDLVLSPLDGSRRVIVLLPLGGVADWQREATRLRGLFEETGLAENSEAIWTGTYPRSAAIQEGLISTLARSLAVAIASIAALFLAITRSPRRAFLFLLPNLATLACQAGLQKALGMPHDIGTILVYGVTLGLVVDGTFHIAHDIDRSRMDADTASCFRYTLDNSGRALLWAALVMAAGFSTLVFSQFAPNARFGLLLAAGMLIGAVCDNCLLTLFLRPRQSPSESAGRGR